MNRLVLPVKSLFLSVGSCLLAHFLVLPVESFLVYRLLNLGSKFKNFFLKFLKKFHIE